MRLLPLFTLALLGSACSEPASVRKEGPGAEECFDGIDNDGDGDRDCEDKGCFESEACIGEVPWQTPEANPSTQATEASTADGLSVELTWHDDGELPFDLDFDGRMDIGCGDSVDIDIVDPLSRNVWNFGIVDTDGGWLGEDCYAGMGAFQWCHPIGRQATLTQACSVDDMVAGQTTYLHAGQIDSLTYVLEHGEDCYTWGADPAYYVLLGCWSM